MTHFFVLFPQASEPSMNLNISKMVYLLQLGKSLGSLVQISKWYDSYLDERGRRKAKKLTNMAIYRLLIECVWALLLL